MPSLAEKRSLEQFLLRSIPLLQAMQLEVARADEGEVVLQAPLQPNINQHGTAFGGSLVTSAVVAAWSALHMRLIKADQHPQVVVQRHQMDYVRPVRGGFVARARVDDEAAWARFLDTLASRRRARLTVSATIEDDGGMAARFVGEFVALALTNADA